MTHPSLASRLRDVSLMAASASREEKREAMQAALTSIATELRTFAIEADKQTADLNTKNDEIETLKADVTMALDALQEIGSQASTVHESILGEPVEPASSLNLESAARVIAFAGVGR